MKLKEKKEAIKLRENTSLSMREIAEKLGVAKSSVSLWVRDIELNEWQIRELKNKNPLFNNQISGHIVRSQKCRELRKRYQEEGRQKAKEGNSDHKSLCMLYWAEGAKSKNSFSFANSDVFMMKYILNILRENCFRIGNDKITIKFNCYTNNGLSFEDIKKWWLKNLDLPESCCRKSSVNYYPKSSYGKKKGKLKYGCATIHISSTKLIQHIYGAIQEYCDFENEKWLG